MSLSFIPRVFMVESLVRDVMMEEGQERGHVEGLDFLIGLDLSMLMALTVEEGSMSRTAVTEESE